MGGGAVAVQLEVTGTSTMAWLARDGLREMAKILRQSFEDQTNRLLQIVHENASTSSYYAGKHGEHCSGHPRVFASRGLSLFGSVILVHVSRILDYFKAGWF